MVAKFQDASSKLLDSMRQAWLKKHGVPLPVPTLTAQQHAEIEECFEMLDRDGSGAIDVQEIIHAFGALGFAISQEAIEELMLEADPDGSGELEFDEFLSLMGRALYHPDEQGKALVAKTGSGDLSFHDMVRAFRRKKLIESLMRGGEARLKVVEFHEKVQGLIRAETQELRQRQATHAIFERMESMKAEGRKLSKISAPVSQRSQKVKAKFQNAVAASLGAFESLYRRHQHTPGGDQDDLAADTTTQPHSGARAVSDDGAAGISHDPSLSPLRRGSVCFETGSTFVTEVSGLPGLAGGLPASLQTYGSPKTSPRSGATSNRSTADGFPHNHPLVRFDKLTVNPQTHRRVTTAVLKYLKQLDEQAKKQEQKFDESVRLNAALVHPPPDRSDYKMVVQPLRPPSRIHPRTASSCPPLTATGGPAPPPPPSAPLTAATAATTAAAAPTTAAAAGGPHTATRGETAAGRILLRSGSPHAADTPAALCSRSKQHIALSRSVRQTRSAQGSRKRSGGEGDSATTTATTSHHGLSSGAPAQTSPSPFSSSRAFQPVNGTESNKALLEPKLSRSRSGTAAPSTAAWMEFIAAASPFIAGSSAPLPTNPTPVPQLFTFQRSCSPPPAPPSGTSMPHRAWRKMPTFTAPGCSPTPAFTRGVSGTGNTHVAVALSNTAASPPAVRPGTTDPLRVPLLHSNTHTTITAPSSQEPYVSGTCTSATLPELSIPLDAAASWARGWTGPRNWSRSGAGSEDRETEDGAHHLANDGSDSGLGGRGNTAPSMLPGLHAPYNNGVFGSSGSASPTPTSVSQQSVCQYAGPHPLASVASACTGSGVALVTPQPVLQPPQPLSRPLAPSPMVHNPDPSDPQPMTQIQIQMQMQDLHGGSAGGAFVRHPAPHAESEPSGTEPPLTQASLVSCGRCSEDHHSPCGVASRAHSSSPVAEKSKLACADSMIASYYGSTGGGGGGGVWTQTLRDQHSSAGLVSQGSGGVSSPRTPTTQLGMVPPVGGVAAAGGGKGNRRLSSGLSMSNKGSGFSHGPFRPAARGPALLGTASGPAAAALIEGIVSITPAIAFAAGTSGDSAGGQIAANHGVVSDRFTYGRSALRPSGSARLGSSRLGSGRAACTRAGIRSAAASADGESMHFAVNAGGIHAVRKSAGIFDVHCRSAADVAATPRGTEHNAVYNRLISVAAAAAALVEQMQKDSNTGHIIISNNNDDDGNNNNNNAEEGMVLDMDAILEDAAVANAEMSSASSPRLVLSPFCSLSGLSAATAAVMPQPAATSATEAEAEGGAVTHRTHTSCVSSAHGSYSSAPSVSLTRRTSTSLGHAGPLSGRDSPELLPRGISAPPSPPPNALSRLQQAPQSRPPSVLQHAGSPAIRTASRSQPLPLSRTPSVKQRDGAEGPAAMEPHMASVPLVSAASNAASHAPTHPVATAAATSSSSPSAPSTPVLGAIPSLRSRSPGGFAPRGAYMSLQLLQRNASGSGTPNGASRRGKSQTAEPQRRNTAVPDRVVVTYFGQNLPRAGNGSIVLPAMAGAPTPAAAPTPLLPTPPSPTPSVMNGRPGSPLYASQPQLPPPTSTTLPPHSRMMMSASGPTASYAPSPALAPSSPLIPPPGSLGSPQEGLCSTATSPPPWHPSAAAHLPQPSTPVCTSPCGSASFPNTTAPAAGAVVGAAAGAVLSVPAFVAGKVSPEPSTPSLMAKRASASGPRLSSSTTRKPPAMTALPRGKPDAGAGSGLGPWD